MLFNAHTILVAPLLWISPLVQASSDKLRRQLQPPGGGGGGGARTCSNNPAPSFGGPRGTEVCVTGFVSGETYSYPEDYGSVLNEHSSYVCPTSGVRVIVGNGIPNHSVKITNPSNPCVYNWMVTLPLNPSFSGTNSEPGALGIVGMALNGVPIYGAQEGGGLNAVEIDAQTQGVQFGGHAAPGGNWHYHSGEVGMVQDVGDWGSEDLLGYAMDGFPIYGPMFDTSILDECNGIGDSPETYRYHVRTLSQVDETLEYCDGTSAAVNWGYTIGCFKGTFDLSSVQDSSTSTIPDDCILDGDGDDATPTPLMPSPTSAPTTSGSATIAIIVLPCLFGSTMMFATILPILSFLF